MTIALAVLNGSIESPLKGKGKSRAIAIHASGESSPFGNATGGRLVIPFDLASGDTVKFTTGDESLEATVCFRDETRLTLVEKQDPKPAFVPTTEKPEPKASDVAPSVVEEESDG